MSNQRPYEYYDTQEENYKLFLRRQDYKFCSKLNQEMPKIKKRKKQPPKKKPVEEKPFKFPPLRNPYFDSPYPQIFTDRDRAKKIIKSIAEKHGITYEDIIGDSKKRVHLYPRYEAISEVKKAFPMRSTTQLGKMFNDRDHSTIHNALMRVKQLQQQGKWPPKVIDTP